MSFKVISTWTVGTNPFYTYVTTQEGNKKNGKLPKHNHCNVLRLKVFIIIAYFNSLIHSEYIWHIKMNLLNEITKKILPKCFADKTPCDNLTVSGQTCIPILIINANPARPANQPSTPTI